MLGSGDITSRMVLQSGKPLPLFGQGSSKVTACKRFADSVPCCFNLPWRLSECCAGYVRNTASWILAADGALRDTSRVELAAGRAFFIGEGVKTMRQLNEVCPHHFQEVRSALHDCIGPQMTWRGALGANGPYENVSIPFEISYVIGMMSCVIDTLTFHKVRSFHLPSLLLLLTPCWLAHS